MPLKILVAEDDRHTRRILEHIFTKDPAFRDQEAQLFLAPDGEEALKTFEKEQPDLVISDLLMPRLDGFALCRAIRRLPYGKDVPVIVTSAIYKETALLNRMRDELGVEFFAKPFQVRELVRGVQRLLEKRQRAGAGRQTRQERPRARTAEVRRLQGELAERPLAMLLFDLLEEQATGVLTLRRGRIKKEIFVIHGVPVGAESNIRTETLGHYLVAKRVLDEAQHQRALATSKEQHLSLMEAIAKLGWLSETDVFRHHTALVKLKIINSLRWHDGTYAFLPGDSFSDRIPKAAIDLTTILFLGLQRVTSLDEATRQLEPVANHRLRLTPRAERYREPFAKVFGDEVMNLLAGQPSLNDLLRKGVEPLKAYLHSCALVETGMALLGEAEAEVAPAPVPAEDPIGLRQLKHEATRSPEKRKPTAAESSDGLLYEEIFGVDEISVVSVMPSPEQPMGRPPVDSGEMDIAIQLDEDLGPALQTLSPAEARKLVVSTYLGIHDRNHYELLGVEPSAVPARIQEACDELRQRFAVERFMDCDLGLDHPKLEEINYLLGQAQNVLLDPIRRATYDEELRQAAEAPRVDPVEAEMHFRTGESLLGEGQPAKALASFAKAVEIDPDSPDYHAALGWATYLAAPGSAPSQQEALRHLEQALALNPDDTGALRWLGTLCARTGDTARAVQSLDRALDLDPGSVDVFDELAAIHAKNGDWKLLERQHRLVLHRLGSRDPARAVALWKSLAAVYRDSLGDRDSARTSLEVALSLAPQDEELRAAIAALAQPDPARWREAAAELLTRLQERPAELAPLQELFRLYHAVGQPDAAYLAASLLAYRGAADPEATAIHARFRPRFLPRIRRELDHEVWGRIRHPDDDAETAVLFETLAGLPPDFDFEAPPPADMGRIVPPEDFPPVFRRVLDYLCGLLALPMPTVHARAGATEAPCVVLHPTAPLLLLDESLLGAEEAPVLAAHLARALPFFWAGRAFGIALSTKQLRNVLMAAMKVVAPRLKVEDPGGAIGRIHDRLQAAPEDLRTRLTEVITSLTKERSSLNITRWMKGMARSADRLALVVVTDPELVLASYPGAARPEALEAIQSFALSPGHMELREHLGTSIAV